MEGCNGGVEEVIEGWKSRREKGKEKMVRWKGGGTVWWSKHTLISNCSTKSIRNIKNNSHFHTVNIRT